MVLVASLIISFISLLIAGAALYFSHLRKSRIDAILGPDFDVYHHDYETGTSTGFIIPISFINDSPSTGTVIKVGVSIHQKGCEEEIFFMQWHKFEYLNEKTRKWEHEEDAHPLVLAEKSGIHKNVWCIWHAQNSKKLLLEKGTYELCLHYWTAEQKEPLKVVKTFFVSKEISDVFAEWRDAKETSSLKFVLDKELEYNKLMNSDEFSKLL
jgi:hypothetical protein